jgi:hypothetical protein
MSGKAKDQTQALNIPFTLMTQGDLVQEALAVAKDQTQGDLVQEALAVAKDQT